MAFDLIHGKFARIGARVKIRDSAIERVRIDVGLDPRGEFFDLAVHPVRARLHVLDVRPEDKHLLLMVDDGPETPIRRREGKQKFLCGHDERFWFVAAIPERTSASTVPTAKDALKPEAVREAEKQARLKTRERKRRKNRAFVRQGEWFFVPAPLVRVKPLEVRHHEPLQRGGGKPHWAEYCWRHGGESVYVSAMHPNGLTDREHERWKRAHPNTPLEFAIMRRNASVFVRGKVKHPDHATVKLNGWHKVEMNTETRARAMRHVAFLD